MTTPATSPATAPQLSKSAPASRRKRRRQKPRSKHRALNLAIFLFLAVVALSPTINVLTADRAFLRPAALLVAALCALVFFYHYKVTSLGVQFVALSAALTVLSAISGVLVGLEGISPAKAIGLTLVLFVAPSIFYHHREVLYRFVVASLALHFVFTVLQLLGTPDLAYSFVTYANEAQPVDLLERTTYWGERVVVPYLPQLRPSGWFPSPTYVNVFCVFLWSQLVATKVDDNRRVLFAIGSFFILLGSTMGVFLTALSVLYLGYKRSVRTLLWGAGLTLALYAALAPYQFDYNFNFADIAASFLSRLDLWSSTGESILQQNPLALIGGACVVIGALLLARRIDVLLTLKIVVTLGLPVMTHDVSSSLLYWLIVALTCSPLLPIRFMTPRVSHSRGTVTAAPMRAGVSVPSV